MSLLFIDGFDHYATADLNKKGWTNTSNSPGMIAPTGGRRGGGALSGSMTGDGFEFNVRRSFTSVATVVVGCAFAAQFGVGVIDGGNQILLLRDTNTTQASLYVTFDGILNVYLGDDASSLIATSGTPVLTLDGNYDYIEWKYTVDPSAGATEVRVNGVTVASASGVNTRASANSSANVLVLGHWPYLYPYAMTFWYDDLYLLNTSGTANNDFLGDCRVVTLRPVADGSYSDFVPSSGTAHYALVDDTTPDTTDYVSSLTPGDKDSYVFSDVTGSGSVFGVQVVNGALKDDGGIRTMANLVKSGASEVQSTPVTPRTSLTYTATVHETDPATSAQWTVAAVNAAEFGVVLVS
jgi:hypothetical protein